MRTTCISKEAVTNGWEASRQGGGEKREQDPDWGAPQLGFYLGPASDHLARTPWEGI